MTARRRQVLVAIAVLSAACGGDIGSSPPVDDCMREPGSGDVFELGPCNDYDDLLMCPDAIPPTGRECRQIDGQDNQQWFCCSMDGAR